MTDRELMHQALQDQAQKAASVLRAVVSGLESALTNAANSQPVQEPVGEAADMPGANGFTVAIFESAKVPAGTKVYITTQRKPLTDEQIMTIGKELGVKCRLGGNHNIDFDYARAIEAAHGIKEQS